MNPYLRLSPAFGFINHEQHTCVSTITIPDPDPCSVPNREHSFVIANITLNFKYKDISFMPRDHVQPEETATSGNAALHTDGLPTQEFIIWTPLFIGVFGVLLVLCLSFASVFTQGWLNGYYSATAIYTLYLCLIGAIWIALLITTPGTWIRIGAVSGVIWSALQGFQFWLINSAHANQISLITSSATATDCALLITNLLLVTGYAPLRHKGEIWLVRLLFVIGIAIVVAGSFLSHSVNSLFLTSEQYIAPVALLLTVTIWWLRPACWRTQPGPMFLLGGAAALYILISLPGIKGEANFFFHQVFLIAMLLGGTRLLQEAIRQRGWQRHQDHTGI